MAILISLNILFKKHITMKKLIFSFIAVATAILVSCNEEFEENKEKYAAGLLKYKEKMIVLKNKKETKTFRRLGGSVI